MALLQSRGFRRTIYGQIKDNSIPRLPNNEEIPITDMSHLWNQFEKCHFNSSLGLYSISLHPLTVPFISQFISPEWCLESSFVCCKHFFTNVTFIHRVFRYMFNFLSITHTRAHKHTQLKHIHMIQKITL